MCRPKVGEIWSIKIEDLSSYVHPSMRRYTPNLVLILGVYSERTLTPIEGPTRIEKGNFIKSINIQPNEINYSGPFNDEDLKQIYEKFRDAPEIKELVLKCMVILGNNYTLTKQGSLIRIDDETIVS